MEFLAIVCGLILLYRPQFFAILQNDRWYESWQIKIAGTISLTDSPVIGTTLVLVLPVLGVYWLLAFFEDALFGLPYFLINLCVLLYAFGRGDSREQVDELVNDLNRDDLQAAFHDLAVLTVDVSEGQAVDVATFTEELKARLAYSYFERYFAVLFWFVVAGAPLALLYRLSVLYTQNKVASKDTAEVSQRWLWFMEWLPLRIVGLTLAFVGHFDSCVQRWWELLWSVQSSQRTLLALVNGALDGSVEQQTAAPAQVVRTVEQLFFNAVVCWLVVIALGVVIF